MSDVVVTSSEDAGETTADSLTVSAVAESARQSAIAEVSAVQAVEASQGTELHATVAEDAARTASDSAVNAVDAANTSATARDEVLAAVSSLAAVVADLRAEREKVTSPAPPTPVASPPASEDTTPKKVPFIKRKWGKKS